MATAETGHHASRIYTDQDGNLHLNGASIYADESGTAISGADLTAVDGALSTAAEIDRVADVSARLVAAGSTLTLTVASHEGKTIILDTAAGSTITLPAATGTGAVFKFVVSVKPTSNQHRVNVVGSDAFFGSVNNGDADATTQLFFAAAADADQVNLNGTTTGGQVGDWLQIQDIASGKWHIRGQLVCPAGSNSATPFATGQVS